MRVVDLPRKAPVSRELEESTMNNTTNTGGPAFPHDPDAQFNERSGMTLRDYFAAKTMQSVLDGSWPDLHLKPKQHLSPIENSAVFAYEIADAMLKARGDTE